MQSTKPPQNPNPYSLPKCTSRTTCFSTKRFGFGNPDTPDPMTLTLGEQAGIVHESALQQSQVRDCVTCKPSSGGWVKSSTLQATSQLEGTSTSKVTCTVQ